MRELVASLNTYFTALGCTTAAKQEALIVDDPGFLGTQRQTIVAGQARSVTEQDIRTSLANFVVIEDGVPSEQFERLRTIAAGIATTPEVLTISRFLDRTWGAAEAASRARDLASAAEDVSLPPGMRRAERPDPTRTYANQRLSLEGEEGDVPALQYCDRWINGGDKLLAVLAGAGFGKSELTRVLSWSASLRYFTRAGESETNELLPVVLRVRLRDLAELSLEAVARHLQVDWHLLGIRNADVVVQLLFHRRIVLLLDGLDEMSAAYDDIARGLDEMRDLAEEGARILVTSRSGYFAAEGPIRTQLQGHTLAHLRELTEEGSVQLLRNYSVAAQEAKTLVNSLPPELRGIPLFILWAWNSGFVGDAVKSHAEVLLQMVEHFCRRDEHRLRMSSSEQMTILKDIAYQLGFFGPLRRSDLVVLVGDEATPFVEGPHALLVYDRDHVGFRDLTFESLFLAEGVASQWGDTSTQEDVFRSWLGDRVGERPLPSLTLDFLAQLLPSAELRKAWQLAGQAPTVYKPFVRRNLLGIALRVLARDGDPVDPKARGTLLEDILGERSLRGTALQDLVLEKLDLAGWDLKEVNGTGGYIAYCKFDPTSFDEGVSSAEVVDCSGLEPVTSEAEFIRRGRKRLTSALRPWINRTTSYVSLHPRIAETTRGLDKTVMKTLRARGLVEFQKAVRGEVSIVLTPRGAEVLRLYASGSETADSDLNAVLSEIGRMG